MAPRSQPPASAAVRRKNKQVQQESESESESDEEGSQAQGTSATQGGTPQKGGLSENEIKTKAAQLVRFALFSEYKRVIIRREMISKELNLKASSSSSRAFPQILARAQTILRQTFGMELAEVRGKGKGEGVAVNGDGTVVLGNSNGKKKGKGKRTRLEEIQEEDEDEEEEESSTQAEAEATQSKGTGTKSYILRSILPPEMVKAMSTPNPFPAFNIGRNGRPTEPEENTYEPEDTVDSGALLRLEKADGSGSGGIGLLGVRTVILCLVLCLGRVVKDDHLHALLKRVNLERETVLPLPSTDTKEPSLTLDKYLDKLAAQNYLEKVKIPGYDQSAVEWRWGNREVEFSEVAAAAFIEKIFFNDEDPSDSSDDERPRRGARRDRVEEKEKARKKLKEDIAKAAGSELTGSL